ncbi:hypothetical protein BCR34DRAFT_390768 [Clohesyomyces aquaticus]|uniref:Uncharacterized protein n=1 Tax=Clohesyomyces aquaticus TaxID=1231657 RepID=A0A1Y1ZEI8_9PLEO|nr:hypothetical protein BCR34DRAFT_390768 [Clohesyomyces aquaticus]
MANGQVENKQLWRESGAETSLHDGTPQLQNQSPRLSSLPHSSGHVRSCSACDTTCSHWPQRRGRRQHENVSRSWADGSEGIRVRALSWARHRGPWALRSELLFASLRYIHRVLGSGQSSTLPSCNFAANCSRSAAVAGPSPRVSQGFPGLPRAFQGFPGVPRQDIKGRLLEFDEDLGRAAATDA